MSASFASANLDPGHPLAASNRVPERGSPIDELCDGVVNLLAQKLPPSLAIEHFPNKPQEYDFEGRDAAVLVIYDGSRFEKDGLTGAQGIQEMVCLVVTLLVRHLRGATGAYSLTHEIRTALHGQSLAGVTGLRPVKIELDAENEGVFRYSLEFEGRLPAIPSKTSGQQPQLNSIRSTP